MSETCGKCFDVVIEIPRWGFVKRGSGDHVAFVSPLPCPYNYGAIPQYLGLDGDLLDALVIGPRLKRGSRLRMPVRAAIGLTDRGMYDDKLIFCAKPLSAVQRWMVLNFFRCYATFKRVLNFLRRQPGRTACNGWSDVDDALAKAQLREEDWSGPRVAF